MTQSEALCMEKVNEVPALAKIFFMNLKHVLPLRFTRNSHKSMTNQSAAVLLMVGIMMMVMVVKSRANGC